MDRGRQSLVTRIGGDGVVIVIVLVTADSQLQGHLECVKHKRCKPSDKPRDDTRT